MQYKTRESALNALKKFTPLRCYNILGEERCPAEVWLVNHIMDLWRHREKNGKRKKAEKEFRQLKSIARGLGLWNLEYIKVMVRLGGFPKDETRLEKLSYLVKTTEDLLEDSSALESYIRSAGKV